MFYHQGVSLSEYALLFCHGTQTTDYSKICHCLLFHEHGKQNFMGDYKHSTRDPRTEDPRNRGHEDTRTQGPGTQGPEDPRTRGPKDQATCVSVLSSNVQLYRCGSQSLHCYTHNRHSLHQIVLFSSFLYLFFTPQIQE